VTATDLGSGMLAVAEEGARAHGLTNLTFRQADAHALPFADETFDRVTCRFGAMYFADSPTAFREIYRVLKPGGRAAFIAWGAMVENPLMLCCAGPFFKRAAPPPPPPGAPTPFKFAAPGTLAGELRGAGFSPVEEETRTLPLPWPGSPENLWEHFRDIAAPFRPIIEGLSEAEREAAIGEVLSGSRHLQVGEVLAQALIRARFRGTGGHVFVVPRLLGPHSGTRLPRSFGARTSGAHNATS